MVNPSQLLGYITRDGAPADIARLRPCPYPCEPDAKPVAIRHEGGPLKPMHQNDKSLGAPGKVGKKPVLPPFWDPELYGEAFGDFQGGRKKNAEAGGRQRLGDKVRERRISSTLGRRLEKLVDAMLAALQKRKNLHGGDKGVLLNAFRSIVAGKLGTVSPGGFAKAWGLLGVAVTGEEAQGLFLKYGHDKQGRMPYEVFASALLAGRAKLVGMAAGVRGPFRPNQVKRVDFSGKISYPQCRKAVYAPSGFDVNLAVRSAELPKASLWLEFVYGYNGITNTANNLFYTAADEVVYFTAGVAIVYSPQTHTQRFFLGHNDDVTCLAMHPDRKLVATGQVGREPYTCIWDTATCREVARLPEGPGSRGLVALGFSPDGQKLVTVCTDNQHTVEIWDWRGGKVIGEGKGHNGAPPQVFGVEWNPNPGCDEFLTFGVDHIKQWHFTKKNGYHARALSFNKVCPPFTVHCAQCLPSGVILAGTNSGAIAVFENGKLRQVVPAHKDLGSKAVAGVQSTRGLRCLCLSGDKRTLISGGADGRLLFWDVSRGTLGDLLRAVPLESPYGAGKDAPPKVRGLDWRPGEREGGGSIVVGTSRGDLWRIEEASGSADVLIFGHSADLYALAFNPVKAHGFATAAEQDRIFVWDARRRKLLRTTSMGKEVARALAWSCDGLHIAVGMAGGGMKILDAATLQPLYWKKDRDAAIQEMKYSPDSNYLAVGAHDCHIDIYSVAQDYKRVARCMGHSATIRHLDWCVDSALIQSNCSGYEILYWDARSGKQVRQNSRDVKWATWTCVLGFPMVGVWERGSDGTDINACSRSTMGDFVVTADDYGHVRLLNCPSLIEHAPSRKYAGHSSHVMCVRFSPDDKRVVSVGGKDRAVFQWRTHALVGLQGDGASMSKRDFENDGPRYKCEIDGCRICGRGSNATGPIVARAPWDGGELGKL